MISWVGLEKHNYMNLTTSSRASSERALSWWPCKPHKLVQVKKCHPLLIMRRYWLLKNFWKSFSWKSLSICLSWIWFVAEMYQRHGREQWLDSSSKNGYSSHRPYLQGHLVCHMSSLVCVSVRAPSQAEQANGYYDMKWIALDRDSSMKWMNLNPII